MINTSCGHYVACPDELHDLQLKHIGSNGKPEVAYVCFCEKCANEAFASGKVISNKQEEDAWLGHHPHSIKDLALILSEHEDATVAAFARSIAVLLTDVARASIIVRVSAPTDFTLAFPNGINITGAGRLEFEDTATAIACLDGVALTATKPIECNTSRGVVSIHCHWVYEVYRQLCKEIALQLSDTSITSLSLTYQNFTIEFERT